jgi:iron complex outermembrane receptor protein
MGARGTNRYEIGNSDLKTEQNVQTDLNLEYKVDHVEFCQRILQSHQQLLSPLQQEK